MRKKPITVIPKYKNKSQKGTQSSTVVVDQFFTTIRRRMSMITRISSGKGKPMFGYDGFIYTLDRQTETKMIFRCQNRDCISLCHTNPAMAAIVSGPTKHCHALNLECIPVVELRNKIKLRADNSEEPSSAISHSTIRSFPL